MSLDKKICICVEGNIGVGKSTFIKRLKKHYGKDQVEFIAEPVPEWIDCNGENMLEAFYRDPTRYAYTFQSFAFITRVMKLQTPQTKKIRIIERSPLSDYCFAQNCYDQGFMNKLEWEIYNKWWQHFISGLEGKLDGFIYLHASPTTCHKRVLKRARGEECKISAKYLEQLHTQHEQWFPEDADTDTQADLPFLNIPSSNKFLINEDFQAVVLNCVDKFVDHLLKVTSD